MTRDVEDFRDVIRRAERELHEALRLSRRGSATKNSEATRHLNQVLWLLEQVQRLSKKQEQEEEEEKTRRLKTAREDRSSRKPQDRGKK